VPGRGYCRSRCRAVPGRARGQDARARLVEGSSTIWPELRDDDYAASTAQTIEVWRTMHGTQGSDPAKLAAALVTLSDGEALPGRFVASADAMGAVEHKQATVQQQIDANRGLSESLSYDA
jgi:hypothetical protein